MQDNLVQTNSIYGSTCNGFPPKLIGSKPIMHLHQHVPRFMDR